MPAPFAKEKIEEVATDNPEPFCVQLKPVDHDARPFDGTM
jgi:hypothetical protein